MEIKKCKIENNIKSCNELSLRRDSFSDRFCDDLCEVVVSYLSFEDKIRFECVSHQFQRLIFNKQYVLQVFDNRYIDYSINTQNSLELLLEKGFKSEIDLKALESVLKKCKFINKIVINNGYIECENRVKVLQLIAKYVKHLKSIEFDFKDINEKVLLQFGEKCGQKLQNIQFLGSFNSDVYHYKPLIKLCPNLRSLTDLRLEDIVEKNDLLVPKLMSVKGLIVNSDILSFETFINKTKTSLICLGINDFNDKELWKNHLINILNAENLQELHLGLNDCTDSIHSFEAFVKVIQNIGIKCKKINKLCICLDDNEFINDQKYSLFHTFTQLKHLRIRFWSNAVMKSLINCKHLTHLIINSPYQSFHLNDIHLFVPQLTYLCFHTKSHINDNDLQSFSKLKNLESLIMRSHSCSDLTDEGICEIINKCPEIRSIRIEPKPQIIDKTINALISLAKSKPFCDFVHSFGSITYESEEDFDYLEFLKKKFDESLPKNLEFLPFDHSLCFDECRHIYKIIFGF